MVNQNKILVEFMDLDSDGGFPYRDDEHMQLSFGFLVISKFLKVAQHTVFVSELCILQGYRGTFYYV